MKRRRLLNRLPVFCGGIGWRTEPGGGGFSLSLGQDVRLDFPFAQETAAWQADQGRVRLRYVVKRRVGPDSFGVFYLTVPTDRVERGRPAAITVTASAQSSRRWFGLNPYRDTIEQETW